jgi:hypothetical protein
MINLNEKPDRPTALTPAAEADPSEARLTREQASRAVETARTRLDDARVAVRVQQDVVCREARGALARAITQWQEQGCPLTQAQREERERRNFIGEQAAQLKARGGPSSGVMSFVESRIKNPRRGAYSAKEAAKLGFKVPSSRS